MWGDRYLNGKLTGLGEWEASTNKTERAIDLVPKDIMICDWHYEFASSSAVYFAMKGFSVLTCPWRNTEVGLKQFDLLKLVRANDDAKIKNRLQGMMHTTWCGMSPFVKAYYGEENSSKAAKESAECFKTSLRQNPGVG